MMTILNLFVVLTNLLSNSTFHNKYNPVFFIYFQLPKNPSLLCGPQSIQDHIVIMQVDFLLEQNTPPTSQDLSSTKFNVLQHLKSSNSGNSRSTLGKRRTTKDMMSDILIQKPASLLRKYSKILQYSRLRQAFHLQSSKEIEDSPISAQYTDIHTDFNNECTESMIQPPVMNTVEYLSSMEQVIGNGCPLISEEIIEAGLLSEAYPNLAIIGQESQDMIQKFKQESSTLPQSKYITLPRTPLCLPPPDLLQCPLPSIETMYTTLLE